MALIKSILGKSPQFGKDCYLAENATIIGDVTCGMNCSFWFNSVVRGDVHYIKIGKRVNNSAPQSPSVSAADIKKALSGLVSSSPGPVGNPSQINAYIGRIGNFFYNYWTPPASASSAMGSTIVRISMQKNGQIIKV